MPRAILVCLRLYWYIVAVMVPGRGGRTGVWWGHTGLPGAVLVYRGHTGVGGHTGLPRTILVCLGPYRCRWMSILVCHIGRERSILEGRVSILVGG